MNYLDYILGGFLILGFVLGFKDGLIRKIIGLVGYFIAFYLAFNFAEKLGRVLIPVFNGEAQLANMIAGIIIFFLTVLVISILKRILHPFDKVHKLFNQLLGGVVGFVETLYFLSAILLLLSIFNFPKQSVKEKSIFYDEVFNVLPASVDFLFGENSAARNFFKDYTGNDDIKL